MGPPGPGPEDPGALLRPLGAQRCAQITLVSADAAEWIANVVAERCQNAELCLDPFHIVAWATKALDEVRREVWNAARRNGQNAVAKELKGARYALWKNPEDLTARQGAKLASIAATNQRLYRGYLLNYPALGGGSRGSFGAVPGLSRRRWASRLVMTRWWRAVSEVQPRTSASSRSWRMSSS